MRLFKIIETKEFGYIVVPQETILCPFCNNIMLLHKFYAVYDPRGFYHVDVHLKCTYCGFYAIFGVPINAEEYSKLRGSKLNNVFLYGELSRKIAKYYKVENVVAERLRKWGYW